MTVDEMIPLVRIVGLKEMSRKGQGHNLNMRASALKVCSEKKLNYRTSNLLVAHMGGGITLSLHSNGLIIDMISDDEGPFSPERAGGLPSFQLIEKIFTDSETKQSIMNSVQRKGGLMSHLGLSDAREVEKLIEHGDEHAKLIYEALALNISKNIAKLSVVVDGKIDAIILTGGMAYSKMLTAWITQRVEFIAPVKIVAGENEMQALAFGIYKVLSGKETARQYSKEELNPKD